MSLKKDLFGDLGKSLRVGFAKRTLNEITELISGDDETSDGDHTADKLNPRERASALRKAADELTDAARVANLAAKQAEQEASEWEADQQKKSAVYLSEQKNEREQDAEQRKSEIDDELEAMKRRLRKG